MSVLEVYIHWASSVLAEFGGHVDGVQTLQDGKVLCELIDILDPEAGLLKKVKASGDCTALAYTNAALQHMSDHGIPIRFPAEDIVQNDVKSMLDVLWILILNYGIHFIGETAQNRSIGIGKKNLLEWCQERLDTTFDPKDTLTFSLCNSNWFTKLLETVTHHRVQQLEDKSKYIDALLTQIEDMHLIKKDIIKARDIVDGTVDEHSLMIYLSLLKRRVQQANRLTSDSHRSKPSTPTQEVKETGEHEVFPSWGASYIHSDLRSFPNRGLSEQQHRDGTSGWSSLELQFSGSGTFLPPALFQNVSVENDATSHMRSDKFVELLPVAGIDSKVGKETESQMISEKETDTLSEFSSLPPTKEKHVSVIPLRSQEIKHATWDTNSAVVDNQIGNPPKLNITTLKYNTSETATRTYPSTIHKPNYSGSSKPQTEQPYWKLQEHRDREHPRTDDVKIKIKRPKDYIRQWEDTIDRLSTMSVTDEFGAPVSPLISSYKVNLPVRSKSLETGGPSHRNANKSTSTRFGSHYTPGSRSKSSDVLPTTMASSRGVNFRNSSTDHYQNHDSRTTTTFPERSISDVKDPTNIYSQIASSSHPYTDDFSSVPTYTIRSEGSTPKESITVSIDLHSAVPQNSNTAHRTYPKGLFETTEQPILKRRDRFEPPSSGGSRVRFQQQSHILSHEQRAQSERPQLPDHVDGTSVHRVNSFSPQRQTVSSHSLYEGNTQMVSDATSSLSARSRFMPSHYPMPTPRKQESVTNFNHPENPSEDITTKAAYIQRNGKALNDLYSNARLAANDTLSPTNATNFSSGLSIIEHQKEGCTLSINKTSLQRMPLNTEFKSMPNLDLELDLDMTYVDHLTDDGEDSPPPVRRGVNRVPRREAWERDRRIKEDLSFVENPTDIVAQSRSIKVLYNEVEALKEKVEILEDGGTKHNLGRQNRSSSATDNTRHNTSATARKIIDEISQIAAVEQIKASLNKGHERAFSCPLLQPSRRSKATRSSSRSVADLGSSQSTERSYPEVTIYLDRSNRTRSASYPKYSASILGTTQDFKQYTGIRNSSSANKVSPETWGDDFDSAECFDPNKLEKLKWLISRHNLSEYEINELKQSLASVLAENDILHTKLGSFRDDIHNKLKHTNGVLDDCRHHLAKAQAQNMELRTILEQERHKNEAYGRRIKELEKNLSEMKADNEQLGNDLDQTSTLLNHSVNKTRPGVDALKAENCKLTSMLVNAEHENFDLREEVHVLKQNQTKAVNTMDDLRECLLKVRCERQELFEELSSLQRQEQTGRVRKIINNYQEKGSHDEWEREQNLMEEAKRAYLSHPGPRSQSSPDYSYFSPSFKQSRLLDDKTPQRSKPSDRDAFQSTSWQYFNPQQHSRYNEASATHDREIYPHRRGYTSRSRSYSPHQKGRSASSPGYYTPLPMDTSFPDYDWPERGKNTPRERLKFGATDIQYSHPEFRFSYSPCRHKTTNFKSCTPSRSLTQSPQRSGNSKPHSGQYILTRSFSSAEDLSARPFQHRPNLGQFKGRNRSREKQSETSRNQSLYSLRFDDQDFPRTRYLGNRQFVFKSASPERDPENYFRNYSPLTNEPTLYAEKQSFVNKIQTMPLHSKSRDGEMGRMFHKEFEKEEKRVPFLSKSQPWFGLQSESDGEDTGINSSMSSRSSCENACLRNRTSLLSDEQRRYADELIKKYTGNIPLKKVV